jgi:hypothetical protein
MPTTEAGDTNNALTRKHLHRYAVGRSKKTESYGCADVQGEAKPRKVKNNACPHLVVAGKSATEEGEEYGYYDL